MLGIVFHLMSSYLSLYKATIVTEQRERASGRTSPLLRKLRHEKQDAFYEYLKLRKCSQISTYFHLRASLKVLSVI